MIDRETQQKIKDAANIVEVVGDYVKLTRRGANYMGLCPFHNERTPSFSVSPRKNFCHCFSCKKGGSPVNFLMEKEGIGYTEALLLLAKKYNIPVQEKELSEEERQRLSEREAMLIASEWTMNYFHNNLYHTDEGRDIGLAYFYSRGITDEAIRKYKLGYSLDNGEALLRSAVSQGFDIDIFKKIGLIGTSRQGRDYDKFRGRVMFPIRNASGKPIAFGGRTLKGEAAKYINSPESPLYHKSNELYGIFEAKSEIIRQDRVFLMEGYLDVIGSWQAGLQNIVASSGTALTDSQIALIHRFTNNVTLIYDGDDAGKKAALRGIDMLLAQKLHVSVLLLPEGEDPDSFARKHTPEEFNNYIESNQTDFIRFKIEVLLKDASNNPQRLSEAVKSTVSSIASIPDEIERISYIKECANLMGIDEKIITRQVRQALLSSGPKNENRFSQQTVVQEIPEFRPVNSQTLEETQSEETQSEKIKQTSFFNLEREIIRYCVKYAFLPLSISEDETVFVIDYIARELEADEIDFTNPVFRQIFESLRERKNLFETLFNDYKNQVEETLKEAREKFRQSLRIKGGSMAKIKSEEKKYFEEEEKNRVDLHKQFTTTFSIDFLINHEEKGIREIANFMVADRHTLSSLYSNVGSEIIFEEDKLEQLVPRALSELRSEILNQKIHELQKEVARAIETGDGEAQQRLMTKLSKILFIRSRIAENLGERIISPR